MENIEYEKILISKLMKLPFIKIENGVILNNKISIKLNNIQYNYNIDNFSITGMIINNLLNEILFNIQKSAKVIYTKNGIEECINIMNNYKNKCFNPKMLQELIYNSSSYKKIYTNELLDITHFIIDGKLNNDNIYYSPYLNTNDNSFFIFNDFSLNLNINDIIKEEDNIIFQLRYGFVGDIIKIDLNS